MSEAQFTKGSRARIKDLKRLSANRFDGDACNLPLRHPECGVYELDTQ
jgi:hypothetical protein